jgi:hypothetical protein
MNELITRAMRVGLAVASLFVACGGGGGGGGGDPQANVSSNDAISSDGSGDKGVGGSTTPATPLASVASPSGSYTLLAWNDLGMHCVDGKDYSVFSILPPYNNLHAQLVSKASGAMVTNGVSLTYEAMADATGSINTFSVGKTNFWTWVKSLFGV